MYRTLNLAFAILLLFIAGKASAQTNSVKLKDAGGNVISQHSSITTAYAAIPATLTQAYTIELDPGYTGANEVYPIVFVNKAGASAANTITLTIEDPMIGNWIRPNDNTSIFVFDNAGWVIIDGKQEDYSGLVFDHRSSSPGIQFKNGSSNNKVQNTVFYCPMRVPHAVAISFSGTNNMQGNSYNTVEHCIFDSYDAAIHSQGAVSHPNSHLYIARNFMDRVQHHAVKLSEGTGYTTIEKNKIWNLYDTLFTAYIITENFSDTAIILENSIRMLGMNNYQKVSPFRGMYLESGGAGNYFLIANNMIFSPGIERPSGDTTMFGVDPLGNLAMIEFAGTNPIKADVYFNTLVTDNELSPLAIVPAGISSVSLLRSENNPNSSYNIKNNLIVNKRRGGMAGVLHAAIRLSSTNNVNIDYNTYEVGPDGLLAQIGNTDYTTLAAYKAAFTGGNEAHADSMQVPFVSEIDMRLNSLAYQNTRLYGTPIPTVSYDMEQHLRNNNYRGADEYVIACSAAGVPGAIRASAQGCANDMARIDLLNASAVNGTDYQWQYRPLSSADFLDIPDAKGTHIFVRFSDSTEYRLKDSCLAGGPATYSNTILIAEVEPRADSLVFLKSNNIYKFYLAGVKHAAEIHWHIDNVQQPAARDTLTHVATRPQSVRITATVVNGNCTYTLSRRVDLTLSVDGPLSVSTVAIYPNPAQGRIHIETDKPVVYTITDMAGRLIQTGETLNGDISIKELLPGNYILNIENGESERMHGRFLKQ